MKIGYILKFPQPQLNTKEMVKFKYLISVILWIFSFAIIAPNSGTAADEPDLPQSNARDVQQSSNDFGNLKIEGEQFLQEAFELRAKREHKEQAWNEEKPYLDGLIESARIRKSLLESKLQELEILVNRREEELKDLQSRKQLIRELEQSLVARLGNWQERITGITDPYPYLANADIQENLGILEQYSDLDTVEYLDLRLESTLQIVEDLYQFQNTITRVTEIWDFPDNKQELVRLICLGFGGAIYQVQNTKESGVCFFESGTWNREENKFVNKIFTDFWDALESGRPNGVFPIPVKVEVR